MPRSVSDYLPPDSDYYRIIKYGLHGTAMLEWDISDQRLNTIIQYIKTFSERWQDEYEEVGESIVPSEDPFIGRETEAVALGEGDLPWNCKVLELSPGIRGERIHLPGHP